MANPFFMIFPAFDTKWVHWFKKRQQVHDNMAKFKENLDNIITEKRALVAKNMSDGLESEKDLLTLMIESEMSLGGETMSNEELRVSSTKTTLQMLAFSSLKNRATSTCLCLLDTTHRATHWPLLCTSWHKTPYVLLSMQS